MVTAFRPRTLVLFLGDILSFIVALWLSLFLRAFDVPTQQALFAHLYPFSLLFVAWVAVFFIAGLYENRSIILARRALSSTLLTAQTFNMVLAALFFFFVPLFGIAPKTLLLIYLVVSFCVVLLWRAALAPRLWKPENAVAVGNTEEIRELERALNAAHRAPVRVAAVIDSGTPDLAEELHATLARHRSRMVIADWSDTRVSAIFGDVSYYIAEGVRFFDAVSLYETVFGRVALRHVDDRWVARHISRYAHTLYDPLKRAMDIAAALLLGVFSLPFYPFIIALIKLQDGGPIFYAQVRVGERGRPIVMRKFRSMTGADKGAEVLKSRLEVTPFGRVMRKARIDELPQLWNVLKGDLSLIGPRPEFPALVKEYATHIPYYQLRHLVKPGLSGWAQLYHDNHPHHGSDVEATKEKLSYDLYYLTRRSLILDLIIALKTVKKLITRSGV
jgi:exopolysaccharide biosynthesis polyprenyl glycosylphosphotransferase